LSVRFGVMLNSCNHCFILFCRAVFLLRYREPVLASVKQEGAGEHDQARPTTQQASL
jgi:hypothetical protein